MTFERFAALNGLVWHQVQPWQLVQWLKSLAHESPEYRAAELQTVSYAFDSVGLPDPTRSSLVTQCASSNWGLFDPPGWSPKQVEMWRTLPYAVAKLISDKRREDVKAVRACQRLEAHLRKRDDKDAAVIELETEMKNAARPAA